MRAYHLTNPPMRGNDLKPLQEALSKMHLYGGPVDGIFGASTARACKQAKFRLGYPKRALIATGGEQLLDYLRGSKRLSPAFITRRHIRGFGLTRAQKLRAAIVEYAIWCANHAGSIHYAQVRPMDRLRRKYLLPWWVDCSEFVTTMYCWAGGPDPNGWNFNGYGNTDSMYNHGEFIALWDAKPGDVVIWHNFGWGTHHTALIVDVADRHDPKVVAMGSEAGPFHIPFSWENRAQAGRTYVIKRYIKD